MKQIIIIIISLSSVLLVQGEELLSLNYVNALRISSSNIKIKINKNGLLEYQTESRGKNKIIKKGRVSKADLADIQKHLSKLNWDKVLNDKTRGLDGNSVSISSGEKTVTVWSPNYKTAKRGLSKFYALIKTVFSVAGLKENGLPKQKEKTEQN